MSTKLPYGSVNAASSNETAKAKQREADIAYGLIPSEMNKTKQLTQFLNTICKHMQWFRIRLTTHL